jgi:hypothetical protein
MSQLKFITVLVLLSVSFSIIAQPNSKSTAELTTDNEKIENPQAFRIFNAKGKEISYKKMTVALSENDMVFFGELHNNTVSHWLQHELTRDLYAIKGTNLALGAEMFESDNQVIMNEYFLGFISQGNFEKEMRRFLKDGLLGETKEAFVNERRVLTVLSSHKRKIGGTVVGSSKTGSLTFIEPAINVPLNNELELVLDDERKEIFRILQELTREIAHHLPLIEGYQYLLVELDFIQAKTKISYHHQHHRFGQCLQHN